MMNVKLFAVAFLLVLATAGAANITTWDAATSKGAVYWFTMDDANRTAGITFDRANNLNLTEVATPTTGLTGQFGQAYSYAAASNEYLKNATNTANIHGGDNVSVSYWFRPQSETDYLWAWAIGYNAAPNNYIGMIKMPVTWQAVIRTDAGNYKSYTIGGDIIGTTNRTHIVLVYQGTNITAYLNGTQVAVVIGVWNTGAPASTGLLDARASVTINDIFDGAYGYDSDTAFGDEFAVFNYSLSPTEVSNLFNYDYVDVTTTSGYYDAYGLLTDTYTTPAYETNLTNFGFSLWTNTTNVTSAAAALWWNGTKYAATSVSNTTSGTNNSYTWAYTNFALPLVATNYTNITTMWEYNITYVNATTTSANDTANTQAVYHKYYWGTYSPETILYELHPFVMNATFTEPTAGVVYNVTAWFNNTNYTLAGSGGVYTGGATAPDITGYNETFVGNSSFFLNYTGTHGGTLLLARMSANVTSTVYAPALVNCSLGLGTSPMLNFTFKREENLTDLPSNMDSTFTWWTFANHSGVEYTSSFAVVNTINMSLCIYPNTTLYVDSFQVYHDYGGTYRVRNYFLNNATITNTTTSVITLYNIPTLASDLLTLTVADQLVAQPGVFVLMERYYPAENLFRTVEIGKTDADGKTFLYPVPNDVYYRFIVMRNYTTEYSGSPREIGIASFTIDISGSTELEYFAYQGISVACNKTGTMIICSLVNPTGLDVGAILLVKEIGIYTDTLICSTNVTAVTSSTLLCNVSGYSGVIQANLFFIAPESLLTAWTETFNGSGTNVFGGLGLLIGILVIIGSTLLLAYSPALALVGAVLGLAISAITGIVALSLTSVVLILVAAAFIVVKVRS